ncbi:MAG: hypothetical protein ACOX8B_03165 [Lachnospiraceae bacterium]|jgi:foldase protein PrsA
MMKYAKFAAAVLAAGVAAASMGGCSQLSGSSESSDEAVYATFDGKDISLAYVRFQLNEAQYEYEAMFSQYFGSTDFWDQDLSGNGTTMEESVIENVLTSVQQTAILNWYAEQNDITLTDEQQAKVDEAVASAAEKAESDPDFAETVGYSEDLLKQLYQENAIANAVYLKLVENVDTTVGDDEFIQKDMTVVRLGKTDLETETSTEELSLEDVSLAEGEDLTETAGAETTAEQTAEAAESTEAADTAADGSEEETTEAATTLSAEEQQQADEMNAAAKAIEKRLQDGEAAEDIVADYSEDTTYFTTTNTTATVGEDSSYVYTEAAFALSEGETTIYTDSDSGALYILLCTNDNDTEARQEKIDEEIQSRKDTLFQEQYSTIRDEAPKFVINEDVLSTLNFDTPLYEMPESETETEFETDLSAEMESSEESAAAEADTAEEGSWYDTANATEAFATTAETTAEETTAAGTTESGQ